MSATGGRRGSRRPVRPPSTERNWTMLGESHARDNPRRPSAVESVPPSSFGATTMRVRKRNGSTEPVDLNKIVRAIARCCQGLSDVDPMRVATKTISGLYDGATTRELDELSIRTAAGLVVEEPDYGRLA